MTPRLAQLYAIRAMVDALILAEEPDVAPQFPEGACPACGAPESQQHEVTSLADTQRKVLCLACRKERAA